MPTSITGSLHPSNKDAISLNDKGLVAIGTQNLISILDIHTSKIIQILDEHIGAVNVVAFAPESSFIRQNESDPRLASTDIYGQIIVWDVFSASSVSKFKFNNTAVRDLKWLIWQETNRDFLLTLHSNNVLVLWNSDTAARIWEYKFNQPVFKMVPDPFEDGSFAITSHGYEIMILKNVVVHQQITGVSQVINVIGQKSSNESLISHILYHKAYPNIIFAYVNNEYLYAIDIPSKKILYREAIGTIAQILPCSDIDAFYQVSIDGLVSFKVSQVSVDKTKFETHFSYQKICQSEASRPNPKIKVMAASLCSVTQNNLVVVFNTGRILIYQLSLPGKVEPSIYRTTFLTDSVKVDEDLHNICENLSLIQLNQVKGMTHTPAIVRMRPMFEVDMTTDIFKGSQLAAVGTNSGSIFLLDAFDCSVEREFKIHNGPVKCLEWGGGNSIISSSYSTALTASVVVKNNIFIVDIQTGAKKRIRAEIEESPLRFLRVSFYHCYVALSFQKDPLEIWDLKNLKLLRKMSHSCPTIVDMSWSGKFHKLNVISQDMNIYKENLIVLDNENNLYHVVVKGLHVRDGKTVNTDWKRGSSRIKCMVWEDDILAYCDTTNRLGVWNLGTKKCKEANVEDLGTVMKLIFSKLNGDSTLAIVQANGIAIFDTDSMKRIQTIVHHGYNIIDCDLSGATPIYITTECILRIENKKSKNMIERPAFYDMKYIKKLRLSTISPSTLVDSDYFEKYFNIDFFNMIENYDEIAKKRFISKFIGDTDLSDLFQIIESQIYPDRQLKPSLLLFWAPKYYQKRIEEKLKILMAECSTNEQLERNVEWAIIMNKNEWAMSALENSKSENSRLNSYRACLLSADVSAESTQCFVKLVAMNLIANNNISDGVQLLFLIGQGSDACRHLQAQGQWLTSVLYAKANNKIDEITTFDITSKFIEYLLTNNQSIRNSLAIKLAASIGDFDKCINILNNINEVKLAEVINHLKNN
uniref:WD_REPEATS_REGION domain-containing protein n=1 Tax=Rhabditophanes sp. KR3021 TaxID=114890 RepID=A0AC35U8E3_9BILA